MSFAERLLRMQAKARSFSRPTDAQLAEHLGGTLLAEGLIKIEHAQPLDSRYGHHCLAGLASPDLCWLTGFTEPDSPADGRHADLLFIDTETTGLAGGTGTLVFLMGVAQVRDRALLITQWLITRFSAEATLLDALVAHAGQAGRPVELVSYNGKSFDLPLIATRLRLSRRGNPFTGAVHHDLLHPLRTAFGRHWPDCRLQTAEQRLLGVLRTDDMPGHRIPAVWADFVQFGDASEIAAVIKHNRIDLLSLAALLPVLSQVYLEPVTQTGLVSQGPAAFAAAAPLPDAAAIARTQVRRRRRDIARAHLSASEAVLDARALHDLADLHRSSKDWSNATRLWQALAAEGSMAAVEALAKYHEHVSRDFAMARTCSEALCRAAPGHAGHARRLRRVALKLGRNCAPGAAPDLFDACTGLCRPGSASVHVDL